MTKEYFQPSSEKDVEVIDKELVYDGFFRIHRIHLRHRLFGGGWSDVLEREIFERGHVAAVLPYDPQLDEVVLIEQFRAGALKQQPTPWLLEIVAGAIEANEFI